jgi:hypothetical protein
MRRIITGGVLVLSTFLLLGCGSEVERVAGTISGSAEWTGTWPSTGKIWVVLFITPPWDPDFKAGPPPGGDVLRQPDAGTLDFRLKNLAFGTYDALLLSWADPEDLIAATRDHPVSVYGTTLDVLDQATPIVVSKENPDVTGLIMPPFELFESAEDMRSNYPSVQ